MFYHPMLIFSIILISAVILVNMHIKWWLKVITFVYYAILFYKFDSELQKLNDEFKDVLPYKEFLDVRSDFVDGYMNFFAWPILIMLAYSHYLWFKNTESRDGKIFFAATFLITGIFWFWFTFFISMHGYKP